MTLDPAHSYPSREVAEAQHMSASDAEQLPQGSRIVLQLKTRQLFV